MPVLPDSSQETQYIRKLGQKLVDTIPSQYSWPFEFHVIPQKEINAFALPGGPMFVNIGTITAASNEAELAGVMAHEMSHVYMQHSAKQAGKAQTTAEIAGIAEAVLGATTHGTLGSPGASRDPVWRAIRKEIASWPPKSYSTTSAAFNEAHQHAMGVKAYSAGEIAQGGKSGEWARLNKRNGAVFKVPSGVGGATPASLTTPAR
jgi:hypothetical protein